MRSRTMPERFNDVGLNGMVAATGTAAAASPAFYETDVWIATVAITGFVVLILTVINGLFQLRRNLLSKKTEGFTKTENVKGADD